MANNLFKKSFLHKNFKQVSYDSLWNKNGVFTTIRLKGYPPKFIFLQEHLKKLNVSLKKLNIDFNINFIKLNNLLKNEFKKKKTHDHLLRLAINYKIISIDLRKRLKPSKFFTGILVNYKRTNPSIKNLRYNKILGFLKSINTQSSEIILMHRQNILEGCTTNIICVKNKKLYIPKKNYYFGTTLQFIAKHTKRKIFKESLTLKNLKIFDEILLVGAGKGVVALKNIPQIKWKKKSDMVFKELQDLYNSYINKEIET